MRRKAKYGLLLIHGRAVGVIQTQGTIGVTMSEQILKGLMLRGYAHARRRKMRISIVDKLNAHQKRFALNVFLV